MKCIGGNLKNILPIILMLSVCWEKVTNILTINWPRVWNVSLWCSLSCNIRVGKDLNFLYFSFLSKILMLLEVCQKDNQEYLQKQAVHHHGKQPLPLLGNVNCE